MLPPAPTDQSTTSERREAREPSPPSLAGEGGGGGGCSLQHPPTRARYPVTPHQPVNGPPPAQGRRDFRPMTHPYRVHDETVVVLAAAAAPPGAGADPPRTVHQRAVHRVAGQRAHPPLPPAPGPARARGP